MFEAVTNLFPRKVSSLEEFVEVVKEKNCRTVAVEPHQTVKNNVRTGVVGVIGNFHYSLKFITTTPRGKRVIRKEEFFERFGSYRGFADREGRRDAAIKLLLLAEQKIGDLRTNLPGVQVDLMGPGDKPMDETTYANLHKDAEAYGISL